MKTKHTQKTMPAREYYGNRPLWTPETYYRIATTPERTSFPSIFHSFASFLKGVFRW